MRNDLLGSEVQAWFHQLRGIQSYVAAIAGNKQTPAALTYRLELWQAIRHLVGSCLSFW